MKNIILLFIAACTFSFALNAQNANMYDPKAKAILDKVSEEAKTFSTIKAKFSYTLESQQDNTSDTHEGNFITKGKKYKIELMGSVIYFDGKTQWTHMKEAEEVNISEPDLSDDNILNPTNIFSFYAKGFKYKYNSELTENGVKVHEIDLFPENPTEKQYTRVRVKIKSADNSIYSIKYFGRDGVHYTIVVKELVPNTPIDDSSFVFNQKAFPKVEVIDLR